MHNIQFMESINQVLVRGKEKVTQIQQVNSSTIVRA